MKTLALFLAVLLIALPVRAQNFAGTPIAYMDGETQLEGYWSPSQCENGKAPVVLIVHQWKGLTDYEKSRADMLAAQCYNAFAIDMYGKGIRPQSAEEAGAQAGKYKNDPQLARQRLKAALDFARAQNNTDPGRVAIMGYCFGGTMALELARSGADIDGAISFHGGLSTKAPVTEPGIVNASIQVHHGAADPHVPPEEVHAFMEEMNAADADWFLIQYADAVHSFTEKEAGNDPSKGVAYNEKADLRSWAATQDFLYEIFMRPAAGIEMP